MRKTVKTSLSSFCIFCVMSVPVLAHQNSAKVFTGGTGATTRSVNIFQPTPLPAENKAPVEGQTIVLEKTVIYNIRQAGHETRAQRRQRAIGHRYLGFVKQYKGYRYPF